MSLLNRIFNKGNLKTERIHQNEAYTLFQLVGFDFISYELASFIINGTLSMDTVQNSCFFNSWLIEREYTKFKDGVNVSISLNALGDIITFKKNYNETVFTMEFPEILSNSLSESFINEFNRFMEK